MPHYESYGYIGETKGFHCWEYREGFKTSSKLYIPKWRVPDTIPGLVYVCIRTKNEYFPEVIITERDVHKMPSVKNKNIVIMGDIYSEHTHTVRYDARIYNRQIHSLYIPTSFFSDDTFPKSVQITIDWNMSVA